MSFTNKVVIITGAASGIGAAISISFAKLQASLCVTDINDYDLHKVSEECQALSKNKVVGIAADITNNEDIDNILQSVLKEFGKIDVLVNCAGIFRPTNLQDSDIVEKFDEIISVNLKSVVAMTRIVLPQLIKNKGCIINMSSISSSAVFPNSLIYSLAKAGVTTFTKHAAFQLAELGVRVNCISPGFVRTKIIEYAGLDEVETQKFWDGTAMKTPMKKNVQVEEIAELTVFLASDKAASITGSDIVVDAGAGLGTHASVQVLQSNCN